MHDNQFVLDTPQGVLLLTAWDNYVVATCPKFEVNGYPYNVTLSVYHTDGIWELRGDEFLSHKHAWLAVPSHEAWQNVVRLVEHLVAEFTAQRPDILIKGTIADLEESIEYVTRLLNQDGAKRLTEQRKQAERQRLDDYQRQLDEARKGML